MDLNIPILRVDDILIVSIQHPPTDRVISELQNDLTERLVSERPIGVVIDVTAVDIVDSYFSRALNEIAVAAGYLGARAVVVGIQPTAAIPLVKMGLTFAHAQTALDLQQGLDLLRENSDVCRQCQGELDHESTSGHEARAHGMGSRG